MNALQTTETPQRQPAWTTSSRRVDNPNQQPNRHQNAEGPDDGTLREPTEGLGSSCPAPRAILVNSGAKASDPEYIRTSLGWAQVPHFTFVYTLVLTDG